MSVIIEMYTRVASNPVVLTKIADPAFILAVLAGLATFAGALYAFLSYRAGRSQLRRGDFVEAREYLADNRAVLTSMAWSHHSSLHDATLPGLLTQHSWVPQQPFELSRLSVNLADTSATPRAIKLKKSDAKHVLPLAGSGRRYPSYSAAMGELARPRLFANRVCYGLKSADLRTPDPVISVGLTRFFLGLDQSEALAHEFALAHRRQPTADRVNRRSLPLRARMTAPFSGQGRNLVFAVSALTLRIDGERLSFYLHARDAAAVAMAGNLLHLSPSGVFQPTSDDLETARRDCSPWLTLVREYAEEFLGVEEAGGAAGVALSYDDDEPYASINAAYEEGRIKVLVIGMGLDPLTFSPELICISCIDAITFDDVFGDLVIQNAEGFMRGSRLRDGRVIGYELNEKTLVDLGGSRRLSPAALAAITVALKRRQELVALMSG